MNAAAMDKDLHINAEQKRAALDAALKSSTFARADQLKSFLRYVCEMEIEGRGGELTEYLIGVEALGRPTKYSPGDDSAVRNRAFSLRKKLQEYYEHENPDAPIRIELHKGSYCPHFVENCPPEKLNGNDISIYPLPVAPAPLVPVLALHDVPALHEASSDDERKRSLRGFLAGVIITSLFAGTVYLLTGAKRAATSTAPGIAPILAEAWGPILGPRADVLVCVANPPSLSVHPSASPLTVTTTALPSFNDPGGRPMPDELIDWYKQRYPATTDNNFLTITTNATYWGDSIGAMSALKTLVSAGVIPQMLPEKLVAVPTLRRRNVILFGTPEYSPAVTHFLEKCPLTIKYLDSIISRGPGQTSTPIYSHKRDTKNRMTRVYGLITALPSESSTERQHRTVIFSGINSAGAQAAAEFFSSPENLIELRKHLNKEGREKFPPAYQVVVSAETDDSILLSFKYETHRLLPD